MDYVIISLVITIVCVLLVAFNQKQITTFKKTHLQKYCKRGEYYYRIEATQCGYLLTDEKVIQPPIGAEIIEL